MNLYEKTDGKNRMDRPEKVKVEWKKERDYDYHHTAVTKYVWDDFVVWKGKRHIDFCFYTPDEWHLIRKKDRKCLHSGKTAKECMGGLIYSVNRGEDIYAIERTISGSDVVFNEDFTDFKFK